MNKKEVVDLIKELGKTKKPIRTGPRGNVKSYHVGLTDLRKLARKIGKDHSLALELWSSDIHEARIISLLIDDPKLITREQAETQVEQLDEPVYAHVFSSCNASLGKVPFVVDLASDWIASSDKVRRRCGYGLLSEIAGSKKKSAPDDEFFQDHIARIHKNYRNSGKVEGAYALLCMGKRNAKLNATALKVAKEMGPVEYEGDKDCEPFDLVRHLTADHLKKRLGL